jgi:uncharacterized radical SAM superfamily Fe-S cluster-containing enzyme
LHEDRGQEWAEYPKNHTFRWQRMTCVHFWDILHKMKSLLVHIETPDGKRIVSCSISNYTELRRATVHALFESCLQNQQGTMEAYQFVAKEFGMHIDSVRRIIAGRQ